MMHTMKMAFATFEIQIFFVQKSMLVSMSKTVPYRVVCALCAYMYLCKLKCQAYYAVSYAEMWTHTSNPTLHLNQSSHNTLGTRCTFCSPIEFKTCFTVT